MRMNIKMWIVISMFSVVLGAATMNELVWQSEPEQAYNVEESDIYIMDGSELDMTIYANREKKL